MEMTTRGQRCLCAFGSGGFSFLFNSMFAKLVTPWEKVVGCQSTVSLRQNTR